MRANVEVLRKMSVNIEIARNEQERINKDEQLLEKDITKYPMLQAMIVAKDPYDKLWTNSLNFTLKYEEWTNGRVAAGLLLICKVFF